MITACQYSVWGLFSYSEPMRMPIEQAGTKATYAADNTQKCKHSAFEHPWERCTEAIILLSGRVFFVCADVRITDSAADEQSTCAFAQWLRCIGLMNHLYDE